MVVVAWCNVGEQLSPASSGVWASNAYTPVFSLHVFSLTRLTARFVRGFILQDGLAIPFRWLLGRHVLGGVWASNALRPILVCGVARIWAPAPFTRSGRVARQSVWFFRCLSSGVAGLPVDRMCISHGCCRWPVFDLKFWAGVFPECGACRANAVRFRICCSWGLIVSNP
jgi:hypothetical protein